MQTNQDSYGSKPRLGAELEGVLVDKERYQQLVGRLIYHSHTRPCIAYAISIVSQFMHSPLESHMEAILRISSYLKITLGKGLIFKKNGELHVEAYRDADWAGSIKDRRSTIGYYMFIRGNLVIWKSKKQNIVARSSAEAKYRAIVYEVLWIRGLLKEPRLELNEPIKIHYDNKATISIAHNPIQHDKTKHVEMNQHFIKEKIEVRKVTTPFVTTGKQLADVLTKGLSSTTFDFTVSKLGMHDMYALA